MAIVKKTLKNGVERWWDTETNRFATREQVAERTKRQRGKKGEAELQDAVKATQNATQAAGDARRQAAQAQRAAQLAEDKAEKASRKVSSLKRFWSMVQMGGGGFGGMK